MCSHAQEKDLHTKRTGHTEFTDKTAEAAAPIVLEKPVAGPSGSGGSNDGKPVGENSAL